MCVWSTPLEPTSPSWLELQRVMTWPSLYQKGTLPMSPPGLFHLLHQKGMKRPQEERTFKNKTSLTERCFWGQHIIGFLCFFRICKGNNSASILAFSNLCIALKFVFKSKSSSIYLVQQIAAVFFKWCDTPCIKWHHFVPSLYINYRNLFLWQEYKLTFKQTYSCAKEEYIEGGLHYFRMESFEYQFLMIVVFLKESVCASICKASFTKEWII